MTRTVREEPRQEAESYVPVPKQIYSRMAQPLPADLAWEDMLRSLPPGLLKPSWGGALSQLALTLLFIGASVFLLVKLPWFLLPIGWAFAGAAATGLFMIGKDCSESSWVDSQLVNEIMGVLASFPLLRVPKFSSAKSPKAKKPAKKLQAKLHTTEVPQDCTRETLPVAATLSLAVVLGLSLYYFTGVYGLIKYWFLPFVAYQIWLHGWDHLYHCRPQGMMARFSPAMYFRLPKMLEVFFYYANVYIPSSTTLTQGIYVPSYRVRSAYSALRERWSQYLPECNLSFSALMQIFAPSPNEGVQEVSDTEVWSTKKWLRGWVKRIYWLHIVILIGVPLIGMYGLATTPLQTKTLVWSVIYYALTGLSITAGYHRLWSHRAYDAAMPMQFFLAIFASGAVEGSAKWWCRNHRAHHRYTDTPKDPYNAKKGFWYAHFGWMMVHPDPESFTPVDITDLKRNPIVEWQHRTYLWQVLFMGFVFPTLVAGLLWGDWRGGYFYAGVCRLIFVHHSTFCVNSVAHYIGEQTFDDERTPRDHIVTALLTLGEGYHNFHHEFPYDYRNGIRFFDYDPTKWIIYFFSLFGLTYNLRTFPHNEIVKGKLNMQQKKLDEQKQLLDWPTPVEQLPEMTWDEVKSRAKLGEGLIVVDGLVHDLSDFIEEHPGGEMIIRGYVGADATAAFHGKVYKHSNAARNLLTRFRVARLAEAKVANEESKKNE